MLIFATSPAHTTSPFYWAIIKPKSTASIDTPENISFLGTSADFSDVHQTSHHLTEVNDTVVRGEEVIY
jgi:hypothetical protein